MPRRITLCVLLALAGCGSRHGSVVNEDGGPGSVGTGGDGALVGGGGSNTGGTGTGGVAGTGGSGDGGAASGTGGVGGETVIIRGDPARTFATATFEARGWAGEDEGRLVVLRAGMVERSPERLVSAKTHVHEGAFRIVLPMGIETDLYKRKQIFVDINGDGRCTPEVDRAFEDYSFLINDLTFVLQGSVPAADNKTERGMRQVAVEATTAICDVMNGAWPES
jgi:hypothetical protein